MKYGAAMDSLTERSSQAERAYERLRSEILHGDLMPGERLRANDLQDRFQLGLTPIREALMRLSTEGLVAAETHRGSRVTQTSLAEFADLMATRREIERLCLTKAIAHGDAGWEAEIVAAMHMLSRTPLPASQEDREAAALWESRHRRFHLALVAACGSDWLLRFWTTLADHSERYRKIRLLHHREAQAEVRDVASEHAAIMEAVIARDVGSACDLLDAHLRATQSSVARLLQMDSAQETTP
jgi:DNA-binding GntR family transcriptional regulator